MTERNKVLIALPRANAFRVTQTKELPMKKQIQTITLMNIDEVAKLLYSYAAKANIVKACISRNRGGSKESTFNESEIASTANTSIYKVITKVQDYRASLATDPSAVERKFEDIPLLIKYFERSFENALKDLANRAGAQKRARYTEILHTFEDTTMEEIHGTWDEYNARERKDILDQVERNLRKTLVNEQQSVTDLLVKAFWLQFKERVTADDELAEELGVSIAMIPNMRDRIIRLISDSSRAEMSEFFKLIRDHKSHWEIGRDEASSANKASVAKKSKEETDFSLVASDLTCEANLATICKKVDGKFQARVLVQVLREVGAVKEIVEIVREFKAEFATAEEALAYKSQVGKEITEGMMKAKAIAADRRQMAVRIFGKNVAA
jgi:hypothetical protein